MRLSNMADYAVVVMGAASRHCGFARVSATELAAETGLALPTTQKLVSILTKAGLLRSMRGAGGGIMLARPPAAITLADIIEAVEGPIAMTSCVDADNHDCALNDSCRIRPQWAVANEAVRGALAGVSLISLASPKPFVSSEDETPIGNAQPPGLSSSAQRAEVYPEPVDGLKANGL